VPTSRDRAVRAEVSAGERIGVLLAACACMLVPGCRQSPTGAQHDAPSSTGPAPTETTSAPNSPAAPLPGRLTQPGDLAYRGPFRLPDAPGDDDWEWGGTAMTYYPGGDPAGPADGYPGSLFATGHDQFQHVSEVSIPVPLISSARNLSGLSVARTLQPFHDIRGRRGCV
jgi:hypothetical protein